MDIETRLDRVESETAIRRLAHEYCHGADKRDRRRFADVWAPGAVWVVSDEQEFAGVDAICDAVAQQWEWFSQMRHWTSNHVVTFEARDPDVASGEADVQVAIHSHDGSWWHGGGAYLDDYTRFDGRWRISRRRVSGTFATAPQALSSPQRKAAHT